MNRWQVSIPINGLRNIIKEPGSELIIDNKKKFRYHGNQRVGCVIIDGGSREDALNEGRYVVDKSLAKIRFAYNTLFYTVAGS